MGSFHFGSTALLYLFATLFAAHPESASALSKITQKEVPTVLQQTDAAILEENDSFVTVMSDRAVRRIGKLKAEVVSRDPEGDRAFILRNIDRNGDYWYWAHLKAREALILALGKQPLEAIKTVESIPNADFLVPEFRWIATPEFVEYLKTADKDIGYQLDTKIGIEVFLVNYQVAQLEREYRSSTIRGKRSQPVPMLDIDIRSLVATPRKGEEDKVGLAALLGLPGGGIYESLAPSSKEYKTREPKVQEKLITASDSQLKLIPVSSTATKALFEQLMSPEQPFDRFLLIEGSMRVSGDVTRLSDDLRVVVNPNAFFARYVNLQADVFKSAKVKKAQ